MYKKSMRQALEEARAYTAIHEVKVSKGRRTLDISKEDLPVYKAKGWKLAEELVTEFKRMTVRIRDKNKMNKAMKDLDRLSAKLNLGLGVLDKGMYQVIQVDGNDRDLNNIAKDLKNFYGAEIKAESIEEAFTRKDFEKLEADNQHDIAAKKLIDMFGTPDEKKEIDAINKRHKQTGYIQGPDYQKRYKMTNKYFSKLK